MCVCVSPIIYIHNVCYTSLLMLDDYCARCGENAAKALPNSVCFVKIRICIRFFDV